MFSRFLYETVTIIPWRIKSALQVIFEFNLKYIHLSRFYLDGPRSHTVYNIKIIIIKPYFLLHASERNSTTDCAHMVNSRIYTIKIIGQK